jgi:peroxiredoxin
MKTIPILLAAFLSLSAQAAVTVGKPAPDFSVKNSEGKTVKLADYKGKTVVLEWLNYGCPFVQKHYNSKNMQGLQEKYTAKDKGVVWLSVISSAKGKQGHSTEAQAEKDRKEHGSHATAVLLDNGGKIGKAYGAETTPHMYVIDKAGLVAYAGAIDSVPSAEASDIKSSTNYVAAALDNVMAGKAADPAQTKAYGCSVKY